MDITHIISQELFYNNPMVGYESMSSSFRIQQEWINSLNTLVGADIEGIANMSTRNTISNYTYTVGVLDVDRYARLAMRKLAGGETDYEAKELAVDVLEALQFVFRAMISSNITTQEATSLLTAELGFKPLQTEVLVTVYAEKKGQCRHLLEKCQATSFADAALVEFRWRLDIEVSVALA